MFSRFLRLLLPAGLMLHSLSALAGEPLRVCADPDNLPFSNRSGAGFDDRIIRLIAGDLHREVVFVWARPRRGFLREQFNKNACDVLLGVPNGLHGVAVTDPYYTSSYAFVTPTRQKLQLVSFTDERLSGKRIGLQILEEDLSPPSLPLIRAGYAAQIVGFESFGNREGDVVNAVADGRVGVAVVWGPVAGYFARQSPVPLTVSLVPSSYTFAGVPFTYGIGFGVHKQDQPLLQALDDSIHRLQPQIDRLLSRFAVPTVMKTKEGR
jgi:mxaJ protein